MDGWMGRGEERPDVIRVYSAVLDMRAHVHFNDKTIDYDYYDY